ncbi:MAG: NUDIX domain-containing protein [Patescibacteria group bacterium]
MPEKFYVTVKGLVVQDGKALILEGKDPQGRLTWDLPGGRIDNGEDVEQALAREVLEELPGSSNLVIERYLHSYRYPIPYEDGTHGFCVIYEIDLNLPRVTVSPEHTGYRWISKEEVPTNEEFAGRRLPQDRKTAILAALQ